MTPRAGARRAAAAATLALSLLLPPAPARAEGCRLALALGFDISASVDPAEYAIQKGGLVSALLNPEVRAAFLGRPGRVWLTVFEWSGWQQQDMALPWTPIDTGADLDAVAARMAAHRRPYDTLSTALGVAMRFGAAQLAAAPEPCARRVLDLSGDGAGNEAEPPGAVRRAPALRGITVNGLAIRGADPDPAAYYRDHVIHGPGAFVMEARGGFADFPEVLRRKLLRETAPPMILGAAGRP
ncbi:DUF1194 domain-containing protein [Rhodovulum sp. DZ06]|uniref:DUF1194 domain-containing protein n=1 Tax=Rhodovulum sp. DZ06 TaxID=3425126 RepID=UPI003D329E51